MRFVDEVTIDVKAGDGGDGCVAFRREAHVPRGGPAGGDGGRGGHVVLRVSRRLTTLLDLRYQRIYRARSGHKGGGKQCTGRDGETKIIEVPAGTLVFDGENGEQLADLVEGEFVVARGGRGGRGNLRFASATNRAPRQSEPGHPGEERRLRLQLKLLADVGLVGLPNAGKSTLISKVSAARPRVADYPFTTLVPSLGVVSLDRERRFVLADIPGLVAGAHRGVGLGHRFLSHVERTRLLVYLLDPRQILDGEGDLASDYHLLRHEVHAHDALLAERPAVIVVNKSDLLSPAQRQVCQASFDPPPLLVSGRTGEGLDGLLSTIWQRLDSPACCLPFGNA